MNVGYHFFTVIRPYLPKRNRCADDYCKLWPIIFFISLFY
jgi:hypothetical protein